MTEVLLPELVRRNLAGTAELLEAFRGGLRPDPIEWIWEWADRERVLSPEASAEHGEYRTDRTPYLREIMECLSPQSPVERVVFMKSAQIGASETGNNFLAYVMAKGLGPTLVVQATLDLAKDYSKQRLDPMVRDTPTLRTKLGERTGTNDANQLLFKAFPGGVMILRGAESAKGLRSMPIRNLFLDEIDAYPRDVEGEGDPCDLAVKRTETFHRRKIFEVSTPTIEGDSRIAERYEVTDKRVFLVPCPECDTYQQLVWKRILFERDDEGVLDRDSVRYACESCGALIEEGDKEGMLARGRWEATARSIDPDVVGFHISALYSPWAEWADVVQRFLAAGRNPRKLQTWANTDLGETFAVEGEAPDWGKLWRRREPYTPALLPLGVRILTCGVDAQKDRIELEVVGWGERIESWSIEYLVLDGDTAREETWRQLDELLNRTWRHAGGGELGLSRMAIDVGDGSHSAPTIHRWARGKLPRVMPVRGRGDASQMVYQRRQAVQRKGKSRRGVLGSFWPVGVGLVKSELYAMLRLQEPASGERAPSGYCHFPAHYDEEYFKQLTSERKSIRPNQKGIPTASWKVIEGRRNEVLDCRVYARAAAFELGIDGWSAEKWERARQDTVPAEVAPSRKSRRKAPASDGYIPRRKGWLGGS